MNLEALYERFLSPEPAARPMLFEVFTDSGDESDAPSRHSLRRTEYDREVGGFRTIGYERKTKKFHQKNAGPVTIGFLSHKNICRI